MAHESSAPHAVKPVTTDMRLLLLLGSILPFLAGLSLFVGTDKTEDYSAWTINSAITAAFIGAAYWAGMCLTLFSAFERSWSRARLALPAVTIFTALGLVSTIIHYDRFHTDDASFGTQFVTWLWLPPYAVGLLLAVGVWGRPARVP